MTQAAILAASGSPGTTTGFKNRIINGGMVIDQRNAGASVTVTNSGQYAVDRFLAYNGNASSKFTAQKNAGSITPPTGFSAYLGVTSTSSYTVGSTEIFLLRQAIEGFNMADLNWGTANAKTVTLSFWVYSSLTGSFGGSLTNGDVNRSYPFSYTVSSANTWTQISITIAGSTTGTWYVDNQTGIRVYWSLGAGSSFNGTANTWATVTDATFPAGSVSVVGTNGATFYITGVQLEVGTTATNFDFRSYGTELYLCQRYFLQYPQTSETNGYFRFGTGITDSTNRGEIFLVFPQLLRATPTFTAVSQTNMSILAGGSSYPINSTPAAAEVSPSGARVFAYVNSGVSTGQTTGISQTNSTAGRFQFNAEL